ncbi:MAG: hypothetical protein JNM90_00420, partial [Burkholderiales bacterium]|nr:hypothetical protein [Burkholderiales bacterium]
MKRKTTWNTRRSIVAMAVAAAWAAQPLAAADSTWNGGTGNWNVAGSWSPAGVPNSALTNVFIDGGNTGAASVVTLNMVAIIGNLTIDAGDALRIADGQSLTMGGVLANAGTFEIQSTFFNTNLVLGGNTAVTGAGTILLSDRSSNRIYGATGAERLSIGAGQSIVGAGRIGLSGSNRLAVTNAGLIAASGSNGLTFNMATVAGAFDNSLGVIEVRDGSFARFD